MSPHVVGDMVLQNVDRLRKPDDNMGAGVIVACNLKVERSLCLDVKDFKMSPTVPQLACTDNMDPKSSAQCFPISNARPETNFTASESESTPEIHSAVSCPKL